MPYPPEVQFTTQEYEIIFRIRQLLGDEKEVFVDEANSNTCNQISASGTIYLLEEPKGYPLDIIVDGVSFSGTDPRVLGYKYLQFTTPVLVSGAAITVIYENFRHSDLEIINTYDSSAMTYLTAQCNLTSADLGIDLLVLATAYILLTKDISVYVKSAVNLEDGTSRFDASNRPKALSDLLKQISTDLKSALSIKTKCAMLSLPVYKVE